MRVLLQEGSRQAKVIRTEFYDDLNDFPLGADMVRRERGEGVKYFVDSLNVRSLVSRASLFAEVGSLGRYRQV